jgi:hypothetical protein
MTKYYWRCRHEGDGTGKSDWSDPTSFDARIPQQGEIKYAAYVRTGFSVAMTSFYVWPFDEATGQFGQRISYTAGETANLHYSDFTKNGRWLVGVTTGNFYAFPFNPGTGAWDVGRVNATAPNLVPTTIAGSPFTSHGHFLHIANNATTSITAAPFDEDTGTFGTTFDVGITGGVVQAVVLKDDAIIVRTTTEVGSVRVYQDSFSAFTPETRVPSTFKSATLNSGGDLIFTLDTTGIKIFEWGSESKFGAKRGDLEATISLTSSTVGKDVHFHEFNGKQYLVVVLDTVNIGPDIFLWDDTTGATKLTTGIDALNGYLRNFTFSDDFKHHICVRGQVSASNGGMQAYSFDAATDTYNAGNVFAPDRESTTGTAYYMITVREPVTP